MDRCAHQEIRLAAAFGDSIPPTIVAHALHAIVPAARSSTYMAIEGRGRITGRRPRWANDVVDIRFHGASPAGHEMILKFVAPRMGLAVPHIYKERDFWRTPPPEQATCIDLLADVIREISVENRDSDAFDQSVLRDIARFANVFADGEIRLAVSSQEPNERPVQITKSTIDHVRSLTRSTPVPHKVRIVGTLDMIRASTQGFALKFDDGSEIAGIYEMGEIANLQPLFRQRVSVSGTLVFRPSGRPLRIDAANVRQAGEESSLWSRLPAASYKPVDIQQFHRVQTKRSGIGAIIGHWPLAGR